MKITIDTVSFSREIINDKIAKKFGKNRYFQQIILDEKNILNFNKIKPALAKLSKKEDERQFEIEKDLKERVETFILKYFKIVPKNTHFNY